MKSMAEVCRDFYNYFGVPFNKFVDSVSTMIYGEPKIDIVKFDDYLHEEHGNFEDKGLSTKDFLSAQYGASVSRFVESLI